MEKIVWYTREYRCPNGITYKTKYPMRDGESLRTGTRRYERSLRKSEKGATEARHELAKCLNSNFTAGRDFHLLLTYDDAGMEGLVSRAGTGKPEALYESAEREIANWIERCRRACRRLGVPFRYVFVTSDKDGETLEDVRVHHHVVIGWECASLCSAIWRGGRSFGKKLRGGKHGDLTDLADYMIAQVRKTAPGKARYHPARNLAKAKAMPPRRARNPEAELRVPKGAEFIWRSESSAGRPQHIRYYREPGGVCP